MKLYLVPTPIGNLDDMSFRAVKVLKEVDVILAEDTRHSGSLLKHFGITTKMRAYHMHNEHNVQDNLIQELSHGKTMALISDAGTPGICDPAYLLIKSCIEHQIEVECLPGPVALIPALINSGFPNHEFLFMGFPPQKKGRKTFFEKMAHEKKTIVLYESPHRIIKSLESIVEHLGAQTPICINRELSKKFEEKIRGSVEDVLNRIKKQALKGELVLVVNNLD